MRREPPSGRRTARRLLSALTTVALLALVALLWPAPFGGAVSYVMVSGASMEPTMHLGDVVVLREQSSYQRGDVVAYRIPKGEVGAGAKVIHRIVGGNGRRGFVTRGDNNRSDDPWRPRTEDVVGKRWVLLPRAGGLFGLLHSGLAVAAFAGLMGAFAALQLMAKRHRRHEEPEPALISWRAPEPPPRLAPGAPGAPTPAEIDLRRWDRADDDRTATRVSTSPWMRDALAGTSGPRH
jgi:signal peptidase I